MRISLSEHFTYGKLLRFVFPSIIMMVFTSIYGVVDGLFVSNIVGETAFASLNLVMPFIMVLSGMGFMVGTGGSALAAKEMGSRNTDRANRYFTMMIYFTLILGVLMTVIGIAFIRPVSYFLGASEDMIDDCVLYGSIVIGFSTAFMLQNVFQSFLAAAERPKLGLLITVAAGLTNAALDALFMMVFRWGLAGAALATGIGQCVGGIIPLIYFLRPNGSPLRLTKTRLEAKPLIKACANGSSELMTNISNSFVSMLYNFRLMEYVGKMGVSAYGVLMYVQFIFIAIYIGYAIGGAPIISYHYGAGNHDELKNLLRKGTVFMGTVGVILTVLALALAKPLAFIFVGYNAELFELTCHAFRLFAFSFILSGFNIFASSFFTALNNGGISALISFLRTLLFQTASVIILPSFFDIDGIWWAITVAEVFAFIISAVFIFAKRKQYNYL